MRDLFFGHPRLSRRALLAGTAATVAATLGAAKWPAAFAVNAAPPKARIGDTTDDYFGTRVADPYRWMENADDPETQAWSDAQAQAARDYLDALPSRPALRARITDLINFPKYGAPYHRGGRYFFDKNDGLQNQSVLYVQKSLSSDPVVVLDPNTFSEDGTVALADTAISHDGTLLAYAVTQSGSDREEIHIRDVDTGTERDEVLQYCKFTAIAWLHDGSGFYYNRWPDWGTLPPAEELTHSRVYLHRLGTPQSADPLVYERPDAPDLTFSPIVTDDGAYLLLYVSMGTEPKNRISYRTITPGAEAASDADAPFVRLLDTADAVYSPITNDGPVMYFSTNLHAPNGRIIAIDTRQPDPAQWREIVPEGPDILDGVSPAHGELTVAYLRDVHHRLMRYTLDGTPRGEIALPTLGTVDTLSGERADNEMFVVFTSFLYPPVIFQYDFTAKGILQPLRASEVQFDPDGYETAQVFVPSKDGTKIPMFLTYKKGLVRDGSNPTLLYGYGGFGISITPWFSTSRIAWLEHGGIFAVANIRGGGEYGEPWHDAGRLANKQHSFDDFIATAEWLTANDYTRPDRLAIKGESNGGLLVAAVTTQRPELFGAVHCDVPVTDMLRFQRFAAGRNWTVEYGNAEKSADDFHWLYAYSPLHNVRRNQPYPPMLISTADSDDRVVPSHPKKFAAALQEAYPGPHPILLRIESKAGHGGSTPLAKIIDEQADIYAFFFDTFGMRA